MKKMHIIEAAAVLVAVALTATGCLDNLKTSKDYGEKPVTSVESAASGGISSEETASETESAAPVIADSAVSSAESASSAADAVASEPAADEVTSEVIAFNPAWEYAGNSKINTGTATLYHAKPSLANGHIICINAGHGTQGGSSVKTLCHPDGSPKVTGGTTEAGATEAVAVSTGTEFLDGTPEAAITLRLALVVRDKLLDAGYDVLMIRETDDVQLDNVARTVMANNNADCHIALHYDGTDSDKGAFFMSVPSDPTYRSMEPVASHYEQHNALGGAVIGGLTAAGIKIFEGGSLEMDLTQTSYSTIPSIDLEVGDTASDYSDAMLASLARGIVAGVENYFA